MIATTQRPWPLVVAAAIACGTFAAPARPSSGLAVPRTLDRMAIDGELEEATWRSPRGRTGAFVAADGAPARPHSEARFARDDARLYVALYAADGDIRGSDAFLVSFFGKTGEHVIEVRPAGVARTDLRDVTSAVDRDGTPDDGSDVDEEWIAEIAVPLASLDAARGALRTTVTRCDAGRCGAWRGTLLLQ